MGFSSRKRWSRGLQGKEVNDFKKGGEKMMRSGAGYENSLHSDPQSSAPGLSYNTFHREAEGDTVYGKTKREGKKRNEIK